MQSLYIPHKHKEVTNTVLAIIYLSDSRPLIEDFSKVKAFLPTCSSAVSHTYVSKHIQSRVSVQIKDAVTSIPYDNYLYKLIYASI